MRVLVTGASGFIGANLVRLLLERGDEPVCLVRREAPALEGLPVRTVRAPLGDLPDEVDALARAMDGCEGVYHLAGTFQTGPGGVDLMVRVHVHGTRGVMRAAERAGVRRVVLCSSSVTVGFGPREAPGDEDTPYDPDRVYGPKRADGRGGFLRAYHDTKLQAEAIVLGWGDVEGVVVNPDYTIGPWDAKPTSNGLVLAMLRGRVPFWPRGGKCFQHVRDCALGHVLAMERGRPGRRYLLGSENLSYREFMGMVARVAGVPGPVAPLPDAAIALAGLVGRVAGRLDPHRFAGLDAWILRSMQQERYRDPRRSREELGVPAAPVERAVEEAVRWFREHGMA